MRREILFRGKRIDNGEWVYGLTLQRPSSVDPQHAKQLFLTPDGYSFPLMIDEDTVCQYTGLTDKEGKKIFDGDIIRRKVYVYSLGRIKPDKERMLIGVVEWYNDGINAGHWTISAKDEHDNPTKYYFDNSYDVIGNIFDNPDLLPASSTDTD